MQYVNHSIKDGGRNEKSPRSVWCLGYRSLCTDLLYIPSLQIKARRGHLWRVTSVEGEGSSIPHPSPLDRLQQHSDPGVQLYREICVNGGFYMMAPWILNTYCHQGYSAHSVWPLSKDPTYNTSQKFGHTYFLLVIVITTTTTIKKIVVEVVVVSAIIVILIIIIMNTFK